MLSGSRGDRKAHGGVTEMLDLTKSRRPHYTVLYEFLFFYLFIVSGEKLCGRAIPVIQSSCGQRGAQVGVRQGRVASGYDGFPYLQGPALLGLTSSYRTNLVFSTSDKQGYQGNNASGWPIFLSS